MIRSRRQTIRSTILGAMAATVLASACAVLAGPPSGRPPLGPLERYEPRRTEVKFEARVVPWKDYANPYRKPEDYRVTPDFIMRRAARVNMPIVFKSTWSEIEPDSLNAQAWVSDIECVGVNEGATFKEGLPFDEQVGQFSIDPSNLRNGNERYQDISNLRWRFRFIVTQWNARIVDESAAASIAWPREFPEEVRDGLKPSLLIQSDAQLFKDAVQHVTQGRLHNVAPYYAAKELVRYCIENVRVNGDGVRRGEQATLIGMELVGALKAAQNQEGTPHDITCVCVATLRAAGIPARPVVGIHNPPNELPTFISWFEFYLPNAGWIPVDPMRLRGSGIRNRELNRPWNGFGNIDNLNERVPISFGFVPPVAGSILEYPALWSWDARGTSLPRCNQQMTWEFNELGMPREDRENRRR